MRATILGSGGGAALPTRHTACVLIREDDHALLVDIGSGAGRVVADPSMLDGVGELHVVLTRFGGSSVRAGPQPRHWAPSAGLRIDDELAVITDTPYETHEIDQTGPPASKYAGDREPGAA